MKNKNIQKKLIENIYIHLPFCHKKCNYCSFPIQAIGQEQANIAHFNDNIQGKYIDYLVKEIEVSMDRYFQNNKIENYIDLKTLYFGGGTPSLISEENLEKLFKDQQIENEYPQEISIEVDPGTFDKNSLQFYQSMGVNRLSMGVQSFNDEQLKLMNRSHDLQSILDSLGIIRNDQLFGNFDRVSMDLIMNGPYFNQKIWEENLKKMLEIKPSHLSIYSMMIEENSLFYKKYLWREEEHPLPLRDEQLENYKFTHNFLKENGYNHYEVSSYNRIDNKSSNKNKNKSKHNMMYWEGDKQFFGFGMGASSLVDRIRYKRPSNLKKYYQYVENLKEKNIVEGELEQGEQRLECVLMGQLRTQKGLDLNKIGKDWGKEVVDGLIRFSEQIQEYNSKLFDKIQFQENLMGNFIKLDMENGVLMTDEIVDGYINYLNQNNIEIFENQL